MLRIASIAAVLLVCLLSGCGTPDGRTDSQPEEEEERTVSTLPWNKPQKWERSGNVGSGGVSY